MHTFYSLNVMIYNNNNSRKLHSHQPTGLPRLERLLCTCKLPCRSIIRYSDRRCGTPARVFSQTLEHGNSNNEIRIRKRRTYKRRAWVWKEVRRVQKNISLGGISLPNQNTIILNNMVVFYKIWKKIQWNSFNKK